MSYQIDEILQYGRKWSYHKSSPHGRWKSWEHCYTVFSEYRDKDTLTESDYDYLALHLSFYLASWGMYRGSCFVLHRDYQIHIPVVKMLMEPTYDSLLNIQCKSYLTDKISLARLFELSSRMKDYYEPIRTEVYAALGKSVPKSDVSDTLITKVLMGAMGCTPAYDTLFIDGRKRVIHERSYSPNSILELSKLWLKHEDEFEVLRNEVSSEGLLYPQMKVLDMCFNARGWRSNPVDKSKAHVATASLMP